ncbi:kinase-like protein [Rhizopogon vinicolor AM-OR11-026]|uniref:Kinase-like protein n=1 Tax=Rhizopogon vinicolor AM-OR11-026 TaxID=1314800 RepID=A0A1B7N3K8_9AGAM|nr:kinase-like protein [Rhizopogon vinicolor AM-OR11-026]
MVFLSTWIFSVLPKKWSRKSQAETEVPQPVHPSVDIDNEHLADLTAKVVKEFTYATAQGSFGDVWKCRYNGQDDNVEVAVKCVRIEIPDDHFKEVVNKRLMDDFFKWKQLKHDHILPLYGITYGFGPVLAIVSPWMHNGSLSTYLDKHHDNLTQVHKFDLLADVAAGLQYLHSKKMAHGDLTGNNVLVDSRGRARIADYGLSTTCSDLNGTSYIRSNVRWAAPELFEVPENDDTCSSPKLESDIYSFGCIAYQILSGQRPYCDIRSDHQVVVAILRGVKPKRPEIPAIEDCHWDFIRQCWLGMSQRPPITNIRDLMDRYKVAM